MARLSNALRRAKKAHSLLYESKMTVRRVVPSSDEYGADVLDEAVTETTIIYQEVTCHFSQASVPAPDLSGKVNRNVIDYKIFCDPSVFLEAGDLIQVSHPERQLPVYYAGKPRVYFTHQEVSLSTDRELV